MQKPFFRSDFEAVAHFSVKAGRKLVLESLDAMVCDL